MASRRRTTYRCEECGAPSSQWVGRCAECGSWDAVGPAGGVTPTPGLGAEVVALHAVSTLATTVWPTGVGELDRVLDGGLVPGSVTLVGGEPGIGKSTLVMQALAGLAASGRRALLVTAEESARQAASRAGRIGAGVEGVSVLADGSLPGVLAAIEAHAPDVVAVDSIQAVADPELPSAPGSVAQVRGCTNELVAVAKRREIAVVLTGHVTKDGDLAGPRALEHAVDTVVAFEGDRHHGLRLLRVLKHRFGATCETGVLEMGGEGLRDVPDPSGLLLADRSLDTPGSVVAPVVEGVRPILVEVQALVTEGGGPMPRRSAQGVDPKRLALLVAVLVERASVEMKTRDVYASIAGGIRVLETGVDLALVLALASAFRGRPVPADLCAIGEVGLGAEVRQVAHASRRLGEAARFGFTRAVVPERCPEVGGIRLLRVRTVTEALAATGLG